MAFHCTIVTPEAQALDETVNQAIIPAHDGLVGILTDRAPLLVKLGIGPLRIDMAGGQQRYFLIDGGIAQMKDNNLTVLTTLATPASELDAQTAKAEFAEATARKATDPKSQEDREHQLEKARAAQALAGKK
jgi:F-type H+-transporting ATPase subunit epsilon